MEIIESETVKIALSVLDKLLADPVSKSLYAKEIRMLFDLISIQKQPPILVSPQEGTES